MGGVCRLDRLFWPLCYHWDRGFFDHRWILAVFIDGSFCEDTDHHLCKRNFKNISRKGSLPPNHCETLARILQTVRSIRLRLSSKAVARDLRAGAGRVEQARRPCRFPLQPAPHPHWVLGRYFYSLNEETVRRAQRVKGQSPFSHEALGPKPCEWLRRCGRLVKGSAAASVRFQK